MKKRWPFSALWTSEKTAEKCRVLPLPLVCSLLASDIFFPVHSHQRVVRTIDFGKTLDLCISEINTIAEISPESQGNHGALNSKHALYWLYQAHQQLTFSIKRPLHSQGSYWVVTHSYQHYAYELTQPLISEISCLLRSLFLRITLATGMENATFFLCILVEMTTHKHKWLHYCWLPSWS